MRVFDPDNEQAGETFRQIDIHGEVAPVKRRKKRPSSICNITHDTPVFDVPIEPAREYRTYEGEAIIHALFIGPDLRTAMYTGPASSMPAERVEHFWSGCKSGESPTTLLRLTESLYSTIAERVSAALKSEMPMEAKRKIAHEWRTIKAFAVSEGWRDNCY